MIVGKSFIPVCQTPNKSKKMSASIFDKKSVEPDDRMLRQQLGKTKEYLDKISSFIKDQYGDLNLDWKFYGQKSGWILKMFNKKRNVLFVVPCSGYFRIAFTFGDKAVEEVIGSGLPDSIKQELLAAKKYSEGRTIQLEIKTSEQCENILSLIRIKMKS